MRKLLLLMSIVLWVVPGFALVSPDLQGVMMRARATDLISVNIVFKDQMDPGLLTSMVKSLPKPERRAMVAKILTDYSTERQAEVMAYLRVMEKQGQATELKSFWIHNGIHCRTTVAVISAIEQRSDVYYVDYDLKPLKLERGNHTPVLPDREIAWGVRKINAPAVWSLGYTGQGVVVGIVDTGVNHNHLDLHDHIWTDANYPNHGWDFEFNDNDPMDESGHGSHCAGSVSSDGTAGSQCGVAPDAQMLCCKVRTVADSVAEWQVFAAWQFCISPPLSPTHGADAMTMSLGWLISWNPHQSTWRTNANTVGAAGIIQCVAAGNESGITPPNSCRCPGNVPSPWRHPANGATGAQSNIISIGATDSLDNIGSFSSLGPVTWQSIAPFNDYVYPPGLTKPDVSAPGVYIKSLNYASNNGYVDGWDGTSMATPHAAGTVALMLQKNPYLTQVQADSILQVTAVDLGAAGKDNTFGAGRINALAAVNATPYPFPIAPLPYRISDPGPGGNNNGLWESGERVNLIVPIRNQTATPVTSCVATLTESDAYITIYNGTANLGTIAAGDTADAVFDVEASATTPLMHLVNFTLNLAHSGGNRDYPLDVYVNPLPNLTYQHTTVTGGNGNGVLDPGETANLIVTLRNEGLVDATGITSQLTTASPYITINDNSGNYPSMAINDTANNLADPYNVTASASTPYGSSVLFNQIVHSGLYNDTLSFNVTVGLMPPSDTGYYYAYWSGGPHTQCPVYSWYAIDTTQTLHVGTPLDYGDDQTGTFTLPFTFRYYGVNYTQISICSNGWIALGSTTSTDYTNTGIPNVDGPPAMVAALWDDLYPGTAGEPACLYYYNDATNHRFVVEWFKVPHISYPLTQETFEIILYDENYYPTPTNDGEIIVQYQHAMMATSNTCGIENSAQTVGIQYFLEGTYHTLAVPITDLFALKYTTWPPSAGVAVKEAETQNAGMVKTSLSVQPNPFRNRIDIRYTIHDTGSKDPSLKVFDVSGRLVKSFSLPTSYFLLPTSVEWNGTDDLGRSVPAGVYFIRLAVGPVGESDGQERIEKAVLLR